MKIKNKGLSLKQGSEIELQSAKVACFAGLFMFGYVSFLTMSTEQNFELAWVNYLTVITPIIMFLTTCLVSYFLFISVDKQRNADLYPYFLILFIIMVCAFFIIMIDLKALLNIFVLMAFEEHTGTGRWLFFVTQIFPLIVITSVFLMRFWAMCLFIFLNSLTPIFKLYWILNYPKVFFAEKWEDLDNGMAISSDFLRDEIMSNVFIIIIVFGIFYFNRFVSNSIQKNEKKNAILGRYFSPDIKKEIEDSAFSIDKQQPKELQVAILFTDIIGFTKISEKMDPKEVLKLLSKYQTLMVDAIFRHGGSVDKFIGDAVMANFGTPKSSDNDAQNAFNCALTMNKKLREWNLDRAKDNLPEISHRIGIHYGHCVVGNSGSEQRTEFAVIGDTVNVASRICDACKEFDTDFLISDSLANKIKLPAKSKRVKRYSIKGRDQKLDIVKIY